MLHALLKSISIEVGHFNVVFGQAIPNWEMLIIQTALWPVKGFERLSNSETRISDIIIPIFKSPKTNFRIISIHSVFGKTVVNYYLFISILSYIESPVSVTLLTFFLRGSPFIPYEMSTNSYNFFLNRILRFQEISK